MAHSLDFSPLAVLVLLSVIPCHGSAQTVTASSCSLSDVQAQANNVTWGATIIVPAGNCTWNNSLTLLRGVNLIGAGLENTTITAGQPFTVPANGLISFAPNSSALGNNDPLRVSGFTFDLNNISYGMLLSSPSTSVMNRVRIDHNRFINVNYAGQTLRGIKFQGAIFGVVDHNIILASGGLSISSYGLNIHSWMNVTRGFGDANNIYYEDNNITSTNTFFDCGHGGRYISRYNTLVYTGSSTLSPALDMHGNQAGQLYSTMVGEVYGNKLNTGNYGVKLLDLRGGQALTFFNRVTTEYPSSSAAGSATKEEFPDNYDGWLATNASVCDGYTCNDGVMHIQDTYYWNNRFGPSSNSSAHIQYTVPYRYLDLSTMTAVGSDSFGDFGLGYNFSNSSFQNGVYSVVVASGSATGQVRRVIRSDGWHTLTVENPWSSPSPQAGDSYRIVMDCATGHGVSDTLIVRENSEYFQQGNATFTGHAEVNNLDGDPHATGLGCGILASMPATCTTGVGYWVTSQSCTSVEDGYVGVNPSTPISGVLFKCTSNDTWTPYYATFDYPHPLVSGKPGVSLIFPEQPYSSQSDNTTFVCSAVDSGNLSNITLYSNFSGVWAPNETRQYDGSQTRAVFNKSLSFGTFLWNCLACDVDGNCDWGNINRTVISAPLETFFLSQNPAGSDDATDCDNAHGISWFHDPVNWDSGEAKISSGDTISMCGPISTENITLRGNGTVTITLDDTLRLG